MVGAFDAPRKSIAWANEGINELDSTLKAFFANVQTVEVTDVDPNTGHKRLKIKLSQSLPDSVARKSFEALQHARNSFDQSLFAACVTINKRPKRDIHFPWRTSPDDLERTFKHVKCVIPVELWDVLRRQEPYGRSEAYAGGDDVVRKLANIANQKHTIGIGVAGFVHGGVHPSVRSGDDGGFLRIPIPRWDAEKDEMTLVEYSGNPEIKNDYRFRFSVVLKEAPPLQGVPITSALKAFVSKAQSALEDLEAEARKIVGA